MMQAQPTPVRASEQGLEQEPVRTQERTGEADFGRNAYAERRYTQPESLRAKDVMDNLGEALDGLGKDFGEVLRHELNNPLTGILGNAELLLSEIRRNDDGRLPVGGLQRLETIATLAVRLRETIRRLSQEWEVRNAVPRENPSDK
jgi:signal transduction histidine kinase